MTAAATLAQLARWREAGWLRPLDLAFASFVHELDPAAPGSLLGASALLTHLQAQGHSCLPLASWGQQAPEVLAWPGEAAQELAEMLGAWPQDAAAAQTQWRSASIALQIDRRDEAAGATPLVLDDGRLYLRRHWRHEREVAAQVLARSGGEAAAIDKPRARALLDALFGPSRSFGHAVAPDLLSEVLIDWQKVACAVALRSRFTIVTGGPGTGKTYTAARLLVLAQALHGGAQPLRVALAAPTGKAASRLRQSIESALQKLPQEVRTAWPIDDWAARLGPAQTLHRLLGTRPGTRRFVHDAAQPLEVDLLIVDEASMVHLEMMAALLGALPAHARLVLLGDKDQLASVEAGAVLGDLCHRTQGHDAATRAWVLDLTGEALPAAAAPTTVAAATAEPHGGGDLAPLAPALAQQIVTLRESRRFAGAIGRLAEAINEGAGVQALALLQQGTDGIALRVSAEAHEVARLATGYGPYLRALRERPHEPAAFEPWVREVVLPRFDDFRILCALRQGPWGVAGQNIAIERSLAAASLLPPRRGEWYEGRPVMVTRNDAALGIFNGDIGVVLRPPGGGELRAYFAAGDGLHSVSVGRLAEVETAFALTVHKSQGSEFGHVVLVLPDADSPVLTRELLYTGVTRARLALTLVVNDPARVLTAAARLTRRLGGLRTRL
jgi:exodeoxyribonuclease V alpha subunit